MALLIQKIIWHYLLNLNLYLPATLTLRYIIKINLQRFLEMGENLFVVVEREKQKLRRNA